MNEFSLRKFRKYRYVQRIKSLVILFSGYNCYKYIDDSHIDEKCSTGQYFIYMTTIILSTIFFL